MRKTRGTGRRKTKAGLTGSETGSKGRKQKRSFDHTKQFILRDGQFVVVPKGETEEEID